MAYIYQIKNDINDKVYVGKTYGSIEQRFKEHCKSSKRPQIEKRPLYNAMNKYGIEHFYIELIEETNNPEEREIYWIEKLGSFKYGYNATMGGDGKKYLDYDVLIAAYKELKSLTKVAELYNCDTHHLSHILKENGINTFTSQEVNQKQFGKLVNQYDLKGNYIQTFSSIREAARFLNKAGASHIADACKGKRKTAYGYKWKFVE